MIPAPLNPKPWIQLDRAPAVFDANGRIVSFVENGAHVLPVCQAHERLVAALAEMTAAYELAATMLGVPADEIAHNVAGAREVLKGCEPAPAAAAVGVRG